MKKVFFSGINGIGMSSLALILKELGYEVLGSDLQEKEISKKMEEKGIKIYIGQKKENISNEKIDIYVYSTAIKEDNEEYIYAKENNIKMMRRGELLAEIMNKLEKSIAVAGTHGKTTTSSLMSMAFLGKDPYIAVGGIIPEISSNSRVGNSEYFIAEADESDNSFLFMKPYYSVITNIEEDHLEFHGNLENIINSFKQFITQTKNKVLACYDNDIIKNLESEKLIFYSTKEKNYDKVSIYAKNIRNENFKTKFEVIKNSKSLGEFELSIPGEHNVSNALAVIYIASEEGVDLEIIKEKISFFKGANRRYQIIYDDKFKIIDDYAHHPTEISVTISAARMNEKKEINVIFEPHRYTRTKFFLNEFAESLKKADNIYLLPIYAASEKNEYNISSNDLKELIGENCKVYEKLELENELLNIDKDNKVYIFMGAGSISAFAHDFVRRLK